jgi:hypothetical protein
MVANTRNAIIGHQDELQRLNDSGSGISQIHNPFLRGLARVGNVAESIIAPRAAAFTPGTEENHQRLLGQEQGYLGKELGNEYKQAQTGQEEALTDYTKARPEIEQSKIEQRQLAVRDRVAQAAASRGQLVTWDNEGVPAFSDDHESQAFKDHQALSAMHQATADKSAVMADIQKNHYIPGTPEWTEAQKKLQQVDQRLKVAMGSLGLRAQGLELRRNDQNANFYGMGPDGNPLPNAPQFQDDEGNVTTGGLKGAKTAITQQSNVGQFKDLAGSIKRTGDYLDALHKSGASLNDVRVIDALHGAEGGVLSTALRSKLVKSGLSTEQVNAIAGLASFREQLGTLRAAAKGTSAEAQTQRMLEAAPTAGDTPELANRKMIELQATYDRLAPSISTIGGGMSLGGRGGRHAGGSGTVMMQAPDGSKQPVPSDQVDHYKKLGAKVVQ